MPDFHWLVINVDLGFVEVDGNHLYIDLSVLVDRATGSPGRLIIAPVSEVKGEDTLEVV